jgi:hypothetical protein
MRQQQQLVSPVEIRERARAEPIAEQLPEARVREDPGEETVSQPGVLKSPFILDRKNRVSSSKRRGKQALPGLERHPVAAVDLDSFRAAARRSLLQERTVHLDRRRLGDSGAGPLNVLRHVRSGAADHPQPAV